jgi:hypothetical protein
MESFRNKAVSLETDYLFSTLENKSLDLFQGNSNRKFETRESYKVYLQKKVKFKQNVLYIKKLK